MNPSAQNHHRRCVDEMNQAARNLSVQDYRAMLEELSVDVEARYEAIKRDIARQAEAG